MWTELETAGVGIGLGDNGFTKRKSSTESADLRFRLWKLLAGLTGTELAEAADIPSRFGRGAVVGNGCAGITFGELMAGWSSV